MKIKAIEVKNLFSYDDFKIEFNEGNIAVIVGPNNAGKTNLFRVLEFLKDVIDEVMSYMSNTFRKDLIGRKMFMYQNNPEKDSYIACNFPVGNCRFNSCGNSTGGCSLDYSKCRKVRNCVC